MKISELISELEKIKSEHGDIDVALGMKQKISPLTNSGTPITKEFEVTSWTDYPNDEKLFVSYGNFKSAGLEVAFIQNFPSPASGDQS